MKIAIYCSTVVPFHAFSLEERPLGGTETGAIRLAQALTECGHDVTVYTPHENPPASNPRYLPKHLIEQAPELDVFISLRDWIPLLFNIPTKFRLFWTGDAHDQFPNYGIGDWRVSSQVHGFLAVSQWQADSLCERSGFPREKSFVMGNGIELGAFAGSEARQRKRLIYSSMPYRGLSHVPRLFSQVRRAHPDSEIHVFSDYTVYDQKQKIESDKKQKLAHEKLIEDLKNTEGVKLHGNIKQKELAREFMRSSVLFYPCHFEETSCITAMEAQAAGCSIVTTKLAALPETIGEAGVLIEGLPGSREYDRAFVEATNRILSDDEYFAQLSNKGLERAQNFTWVHAARRLEEFVKTLA